MLGLFVLAGSTYFGHCEAATVAVQAMDFPRRQNFRDASQNLNVGDRFTRAAPDTIDYKLTVEDPAGFSKPRSADGAPHADQEQIDEHALPGTSSALVSSKWMQGIG